MAIVTDPSQSHVLPSHTRHATAIFDVKDEDNKQELKVQTFMPSAPSSSSAAISSAAQAILPFKKDQSPNLNERFISISNISKLPVEVVRLIINYEYGLFQYMEIFSVRDLEVLITPEEQEIESLLQKSLMLSTIPNMKNSALKCLRYLILELHGDVNSTYPRGFDEMARAVEDGDLERLREVAHLRSKFHQRGDPLQWAVILQKFNRLKHLVEKRIYKKNHTYGTEINNIDSPLERTPLHWATIFNQMTMVEYLTQNGARWDSVDIRGKTPREYLQQDENLIGMTVLQDITLYLRKV